MPVFKSGKGQAPEWCEMRYFEIIRLPSGGEHTLEREDRKERLILGEGKCRIVTGERDFVAEERTKLDLAGSDESRATLHAVTDTVVVRMCGNWGDETGGCGVFKVESSEDPHDRGDPVEYRKETNFDSHYHDCDEYWILFEGGGVAVSEGVHYEVGPGDCVATGRGHHHDFPIVHEPARGAFFETTLEDRKRRGHLWDHTHGPAQPCEDRV